MQSAAEVRKAFLHDAGPAHRMRGGWDEVMTTRGERPWRRPSMARRGFFFSSSGHGGLRNRRRGQKLTEARDSWLSILIWLGSCSIGGEEGGPGGRRRFWGEEDGDRLRVL